MNKRHYEHTLPNIRGSLSNTYICVQGEGQWNGNIRTGGLPAPTRRLDTVL